MFFYFLKKRLFNPDSVHSLKLLRKSGFFKISNFSDMGDLGIKIGESSTFPTDIYLKVRGKKLRAVRTTDLERLTLEEIKDLSREILIQRKV